MGPPNTKKRPKKIQERLGSLHSGAKEVAHEYQISPDGNTEAHGLIIVKKSREM